MKRDRFLQRLLLEEVRDDAAPAGLEKYSEEEQIQNSALLVQEGLVSGDLIRDGAGIIRGVHMTELTPKGHDYLEQFEKEIFTYEDAIRAVKDDSYLASSDDDLRGMLKGCMDIHGSNPIALHRITHAAEMIRLQLNHRISRQGSPDVLTPSSKPKPFMSKLIFISHTHDDKDLADALVDLLSTALHLRRSDFLCTSVEGGELEGGDEPDTVLREQISKVPAFLSLLTPAALNSNYVLFELGARWGCDGHHIPLLARGSGFEVIKPPLKKIGLSLSKENDVHRLVETLGKRLQKEPQPSSSFQTKLTKLVSLAGAVMKIHAQSSERPNSSPGFSSLSEDALRLLAEAPSSAGGTMRIIQTGGGPIISTHTKNQDFMGKTDDPRARARWLRAFEELISADCLADLGNGSYRITKQGFDIADTLVPKTDDMRE